MLSGKLPLSLNDEAKLCAYITPLNSPMQFLGVPNNTPQHSPMESTSGSLETLTYPSTFSPSRSPTFTYTDFQNQLLQSLLNKFPQNSSSKESNWINIPNALPVVTLSPVKATSATCDGNYIGNSQNVSDCNTLSLTKSFGELDLVQHSPFSDEMSTLATCASDRSHVDSLSDFEVSLANEETSCQKQSLSLGDLSDYDFESNEQDLRLLKKASSANDLQEILFNFNE